MHIFIKSLFVFLAMANMAMAKNSYGKGPYGVTPTKNALGNRSCRTLCPDAFEFASLT